ncbi:MULTISPECIES: hypothetical protein [Kitasatospora]|uniref:Uncharacterized protein n=1 Tax=Kitasatospora cineracea TaxID=88074 RepID=A0A8G1XDN0_9ACTN|nr:hypothetical protein [Kitasatospora cineracea]ROR46024.1 hypothetical protein EDD39_4279 [Kitasatospora cineracea]
MDTSRLGSRSVPASPHPHEDLLAHLARTTALAPGEAARVVAEVLAYFAETTEEYVRRRHGELQARGLTNDRIFARLGGELAARRVAAPQLTVRQLRRMVYG